MTFYDFLSGAAVFGFLTCGLFFLRYWTITRDELFLTFALSFGLIGLAQGILALGGIPAEERGPVYVIRLIAFLLILVAIYRKNRSA